MGFGVFLTSDSLRGVEPRAYLGPVGLSLFSKLLVNPRRFVAGQFLDAAPGHEQLVVDLDYLEAQANELVSQPSEPVSERTLTRGGADPAGRDPDALGQEGCQ